MASRKPTLLCVSNFPANTGFAWTVFEGWYAIVANRLAQEGVRTLVAFPQIPASPKTLEGSRAVPIELSLQPRSLSALFRLMITLRRESVRTIWLTDRPARHWTYLFMRLAGVRRILVYDHTSGERNRPSPFKKAVKYLLARLPFQSADLILTASDYVARRHHDIGMTPPHLVRRLWYGVPVDSGSAIDAERCGIPPERPLLLCSCRAATEKGVNYLLDAFEQLPRDHLPERQRPVLLFAGNGPAFPDLERQRDRMTAKADVHFLGYREDIARLYKGADICIVPSVWQDALPFAVLQPMAMGKAVIATAVGGIPEMINSSQVGRLVPPGNPTALANAIDELLKNQPERAAIGVAAKQRVEQYFRPDEQVNTLLECLRPGLVSE